MFIFSLKEFQYQCVDLNFKTEQLFHQSKQSDCINTFTARQFNLFHVRCNKTMHKKSLPIMSNMVTWYNKQTLN